MFHVTAWSSTALCPSRDHVCPGGETNRPPDASQKSLSFSSADVSDLCSGRTYPHRSPCPEQLKSPTSIVLSLGCLEIQSLMIYQICSLSSVLSAVNWYRLMTLNTPPSLVFVVIASNLPVKIGCRLFFGPLDVPGWRVRFVAEGK